jgi:hypothetical protein
VGYTSRFRKKGQLVKNLQLGNGKVSKKVKTADFISHPAFFKLVGVANGQDLVAYPSFQDD